MKLTGLLVLGQRGPLIVLKRAVCLLKTSPGSAGLDLIGQHCRLNMSRGSMELGSAAAEATHDLEMVLLQRAVKAPSAELKLVGSRRRDPRGCARPK